MILNGREITVGTGNDEPTADDLARLDSRTRAARMPYATATREIISARSLRDPRNDWNPYLGLIK